MRIKGLPIEYTAPMVRGLLENWGELEFRTDERLLVLRFDLELRVVRLPHSHLPVVSTLMLAGPGAVKVKAVSEQEVIRSVNRLLRILNVEGLCCRG